MVTALSLPLGLSARADGFSGEGSLQIAFADLAGPRGITLTNGDDEPEEAEIAETPSPTVTFGEAFTDVDEVLDGHSIRDLISGSPLYAPIDGLPEALWKKETCSSCHAWTQETLCTQGEFYSKQGLDALERKEHPYGGAFKREVMRWADRGCE